jgi:hypothetical protein
LIRLNLRHRAEIKAALNAGKPEPLLFPHPDDMVFDRNKLMTVNGPMNEEQHFACLSTCRVRDAFITQFALECAFDGGEWGPSEKHTGAASWAVALDRGLPQRIQLGLDGFDRTTAELFGQTKRELLKRAVAAWRSAYRPKPRGWRMPDRRWIENMLTTVHHIASDILRATKCGDCADETITDIFTEGFARISSVQQKSTG